MEIANLTSHFSSVSHFMVILCHSNKMHSILVSLPLTYAGLWGMKRKLVSQLVTHGVFLSSLLLSELYIGLILA